MTTMNLYIRKHTFSDQYGSEYFFKFADLLANDIPSSTVDAIIGLASNADIFREKVKNVLHPSKGHPLIPIIDPSKNYGFTVMGLVDHKDYTDTFLNLEHRVDSLNALKNLYQELGWTLGELKKVTYQDAEYNEIEQKYEKINLSFFDIDGLYSTAEPVDD
jgi:hypothetical protein